jgi:hypothetical protein
MLNRNVCVRTLSRALVVSSLALSAACNLHAPASPTGKGADLPVGDSVMPEIVITAPRLRPGEPRMGRTAEARVSQDPSVKRSGG